MKRRMCHGLSKLGVLAARLIEGPQAGPVGAWGAVSILAASPLGLAVTRHCALSAACTRQPHGR